MAAFPDYERYDALGLAELVRNGDVKPLELVDAAIERIEARNSRLNAVVFKRFERARAEAEGKLSGPFAGVPFLLKDLMVALEGAPTSSGNRRLMKIAAPADSELVSRYRRAGLIVLGKTNVPEFGLAPVTESEALGPARNPWDLERTPGGSSGGSAAAVAAGFTPIAHATDGGGSIRIPAACCGLFGLKPTRGRTPTGPLIGEAWRGFAIGHAVARSVRDSAALLDAVEGGDVGAPYEIKPPAQPYLEEAATPPGKLKIAISTAPMLAKSIHADCVAAVEKTARLLKGLGHEVVEAAPPIERDAWLMAFIAIVAGETAADIRDTAAALGTPVGLGDFELETFVVALLGRSFRAADYATGARYLQLWSRQVGAFFQDYDALLTPTLSTPPPPIGALKPTPAEKAALSVVARARAGWLMQWTGFTKVLADKSFEFIPCTPLFNVTGQPAASLPLYWNDQGLPIGVQIVARWGDEATLFRLAAQLEKAQPWFDKRPPLL